MEDGDGVEGDEGLLESPFPSSRLPVPASARSITSTTLMRPHGRCTTGSDSEPADIAGGLDSAGDCARG